MLFSFRARKILEIAAIERLFLPRQLVGKKPFPFCENWLDLPVKVIFVTWGQVFVEALRLCLNQISYPRTLSEVFLCLSKIREFFFKLFLKDIDSIILGDLILKLGYLLVLIKMVSAKWNNSLVIVIILSCSRLGIAIILSCSRLGIAIVLRQRATTTAASP